MRGIQINNFFNNHISLNGKKINNNHPTNVYQPLRPQPLVINHIPKNDDPQQIIISNAVTPQMKSKQISISGRKNRANTIAPGIDKKNSRRSKQKFSASQQQIRRPFSAQRYKQIDTSQQHQFSKPFNTSSKKLKPSISKIQKGSGVKRSKSAIIKRSKPQQNSQFSKQFVKESKKNIINSVDNTLKKNSSKKLLKKQTQNLLKQKQKTERGQCRTARVQSNFVKPRKISDKIASQLKGFDNSNMDLKLNKFNTQKKSARTAVTKSYLTSAKQSKPLSARQRKLKKKLFNSKQKYHIKIQDRSNQQYQEYLTSGGNEQQQNSQVNQAISQLQQALQNINSKKALAKQLKKFTNKLKQIADNDEQKSQASSSSQGQVQEEVDFTNQAFKKLKKHGFQKKIAKNTQKRQTIFSNKQASKQHSHSKKSSQKQLSKKKKIQQVVSKSKNAVLDNQQKQAIKKIKNIEIKLNKRNNQVDYNSPIKQIQQPSPFHNYESDESKYIQSKNNSGQKFIQDNNFLYNMNDNSINQNIQETKTRNLNESQVLDQNNIKYMQFLKNLQAEHNANYQDYQSVVKQENKNQIQSYQNLQEQEDQHQQKSQNLIDQINNYLNNAATNTNQLVSNNIPLARLYDSQKNQQQAVGQKGQKIFNNPILQRRRIDNLPHQINRNLNNGLLYGKDNNKYEVMEIKNNNLSDHDDEQADDTQSDEQQNKLNRMNQIQKLKQFSKQSDKMMEKISQTNSNKNQNKKKNLTLQIITNNSNHQNSNRSDSNPAIDPRTSPLSPKYDDRYPHLLKSPKFSDIEITNILAIKQKFLASKHQKMNQLIQKMYEKQLVSPKSYEYSMYQLKKRFQQESDGLDGFRQQASQILKQINKDKDDIKDIDELIREERWQQARKLMKVDSRSASVFSGFKKNKDSKIYQEYQGWQKVEVNKPQEVSPSKRPKIQVVPNNICISIQPTIENKKVWDQKPKQQKPQLIRQDRLVNPGFSLSDSQSSFKQQNHFQNGPDSITQKLEYQFQNKYRLKSNQSYQNDKNYYSQDLRNLQQEVSDYLNVQKADSQDFQNYVYYQSQQNQDVQISQNNSGLSQKKTKQLREQGMFKLIEVQNDSKNSDQDLEQSQNQSKNDDLAENLHQNRTKKSFRNIKNQNSQKNSNKVIEIYDLDARTSQQSPEPEIIQQKNLSLIKVPNISHVSTLLKKSQDSDVNQQDSDNSLIQLEVRKGFESNLFFIKQYCISLCQYIRDNQQKKLKFKENISQPLEFDNIELLKKYRQKANGEYDNRYNSTLAELQYKKIIRKPVSKAISEELADQFNKSYGQLKFYNIDLNRKNRKKFQMQKQSEKKFLAAILQVLNESLDFQRPGSIFGKPLPWANNSKYLKNMKYLNGDKKKKIAADVEQSAQTYDFIFGVAIARIIQWGSCLCGFLPDTAQLENTQIDQDYVVHIRQTRMAFLLQKMLAQEQATINNSQLQQTEVILCLGRQIMEQLFKQAGQQIIKIQQKNSRNDYQ